MKTPAAKKMAKMLLEPTSEEVAPAVGLWVICSLVAIAILWTWIGKLF